LRLEKEQQQEQPQILRLRCAALRMTSLLGLEERATAKARTTTKATAGPSTPLRCAQDDEISLRPYGTGPWRRFAYPGFRCASPWAIFVFSLTGESAHLTVVVLCCARADHRWLGCWAQEERRLVGWLAQGAPGGEFVDLWVEENWKFDLGKISVISRGGFDDLWVYECGRNSTCGSSKSGNRAKCLLVCIVFRGLWLL
jgi:hypothetical protein